MLAARTASLSCDITHCLIMSYEHNRACAPTISSAEMTRILLALASRPGTVARSMGHGIRSPEGPVPGTHGSFSVAPGHLRSPLWCRRHGSHERRRGRTTDWLAMSDRGTNGRTRPPPPVAQGYAKYGGSLVFHSLIRTSAHCTAWPSSTTNSNSPAGV